MLEKHQHRKGNRLTLSKQKTSPLFYAVPFLFLGMAFFGSATPVSKLVGEDMPMIAATAIRMGLAAIILLPFALLKSKDLFTLSKHDWLIVFGVALIGNIGFSLFMLFGMQMVSGVSGAIIMSLTPALTAIAAVIFLKESVNIRKLGALALGLAGVLIMNISGGNNDSGSNIWLGSLLILAAICCESCYTLLGKVATKNMQPLKLATLSALLAGALLLPWFLYKLPSLPWNELNAKDYMALSWWGAGTMALGSIFWYSGVQKVPGHVAAAFMCVMPISALTLSYWLLNENFEWIHLPGFGLAFAGVLLMVTEHAKN